MNSLLKLILVFVFIIGSNITNTIGLTNNIILFFIGLLSAILIFYHKNRLFQYKELVSLIVFVAGYTAFKSITDASEGSRMTGFIVLLSPLVFCAFLVNKTRANVLFLFKLIKYAFLLLVSALLAERALHTHFFINSQSDMITSGSSAGFRSSGFFGHPLQNALIVSCFVLYFLASKSYNIRTKLLYASLGLGAVACCNSRSAMVFVSGMTTIYIANYVFFQKNSIFAKLLTIIGFIVVASCALWLVQSGFVGDRLMSMGLFDDDSAQVRLDIWNIFDYYSVWDFATGLNFNQLSILRDTYGLIAIENYFLLWLLVYGYLFIIPLVVLMILLLKRIGSSISLFSQIIMFAFFIQATTNNSLSACYNPLSIFLFCYYMLSLEETLLLSRSKLNKKQFIC